MNSLNRSVARLLGSVVAGSAAAILMAGCSSAVGAPGSAEARGVGTDSATVSPPRTGPVPTAIATADRALPLDSYLLTTEQRELTSKAEYAAQDRCMARFGFSLPPAPEAAPPNYGPDSKLRISGHYGPQSLSFAKKWGYHPENGLGPLRGASRTSALSAQEERPTADFVTAMTGSNDQGTMTGTPGGQTINGQVVPVNGCLGEAKKAISGSSDLNSVGDYNIAQDMLAETLARSMEDPRVVAVFEKWSACMSDRGFDYETPLTVMEDPRWFKTDLPTKLEIKTAVADQDCRKQENVVGVWYAVDYAYEEQAIEAKAEEMAEVKEGIQVQLKNAAKVLGGS